MGTVKLKNRMTVLVSTIVVLILVCLALPGLMRAQEEWGVNVEAGNADLVWIEENLRILELAKDEWALVNRATRGFRLSVGDLTGYLAGNTVPTSPGVVVNFKVETVEGLVEAHIPPDRALNGRTGPFTITSF